MFRTPAKRGAAKPLSPESSPEEPARATVAQARRSIESKLDSSDPRPAEQARQMPKPRVNYKDRTTEAAARLNRIRMSINMSRNTKTEIKNEIIESALRMMQLVKDAEEGRKYKRMEDTKETQTEQEKRVVKETEGSRGTEELKIELTGKLEEHLMAMKETKETMERLSEEMSRHREELTSQKTYASAVAGSPKARKVEVATALHSIVVTSNDDQDTGEEVMEKIRKAVKAKEEGIKVDRIRKAKDRKVILGCQDKRELEKIKQNIQTNKENLKFEDIKNKDPLVILKYVITSHSDEEIIMAIKKQNRHLLDKIDKDKERIEVTYRRRTRNPLMAHIILRVSPEIWRILTDTGAVFVDVQRVRVEDQSPLVQCSKCLGYGHGRRFCHASLEACSHCGGPHKKAECADWLAAEPSTCCNCQRAKLADVGHNAYSEECPVRKKWDKLARSCIAYC